MIKIIDGKVYVELQTAEYTQEEVKGIKTITPKEIVEHIQNSILSRIQHCEDQFKKALKKGYKIGTIGTGDYVSYFWIENNVVKYFNPKTYEKMKDLYESFKGLGDLHDVIWPKSIKDLMKRCVIEHHNDIPDHYLWYIIKEIESLQ